MTQSVYLRAEGLEPVLAFSDSGPVLDMLDRLMLGWQMVPAIDQGIRHKPALTIERDTAGWVCLVASDGRRVRYSDPVSAACGIIALLYTQQTLADREAFVLHAAGVRIGAGVVVFTGAYRAGKTIATAACAAAGLQVFADDILPLGRDTLEAQAPGLALRLRLPLPENLSSATRDFIDSHRIAQNERYAYIAPPPDRLAARGTSAPLCGIVTLQRTEGAAAKLERLPPADALAEAIRRNFAREAAAGRIIDRLDALVQGLPCLVLTYDRVDDAVALMRASFVGEVPEFSDAPPPPVRPRNRRADPFSAGTRFARSPGIVFRERGGQAFLTDRDETKIFNLNETGLGVWRLLEQPATFGDLVEIFAAAFPDRSTEDLTADLAALLRDLKCSGLIRAEED